MEQRSIFLAVFAFIFQTAIGQSYQTSTGTLTLDDWKPPYASATEAMPSINSMSLRYKFQPTSNYCKVTTSVQWYVGNEVKYNGKVFKTPALKSEHIDLFSLLELTLRAHARVGNESFANIELEIQDMPKTGGTWSRESTKNVPWHLLFIGKSDEEAKRIINEKVVLNTLSIKKIAFGGKESFRQRSFDNFMARANQYMEQSQNQEAIQWLNYAVDMNPQAPEPRRQREAIQRELGAFNQLESRGNDLYRRGRFLEAREAYLQAENLMPNQLQNPERLTEIENRIGKFKRLDYEARVLLEKGQSVQDFLEARERFFAAEEFLPERGNYIEEQISGINRFLRETYTDLLEEGKYLQGQRDFTGAARSFYEASQIFPNRSEPKNLTRGVERMVMKEIEGHYDNDIDVAERARLVALDNAAKVVYQSSEQCYLAQAEYQECMVGFYQQQQKKSDREMRGMLYGERYQIDPMLCRSATCPLENDANPDAVALLESAKRKHRLFRQFQHESFAVYRDKYIEEALARNPCYAEAFYFKSQMAASQMEEMSLLDQALDCNPNLAEARSRRENLNSDFSKAFFGKIAEGDISYLEEALDNNFIAQVRDYQGYSPLEYAVVKNQMVSLDFLFRNVSSLPANAVTNTSQLAYLATENAVEEVLRYLLFQHNADANFSPVGKPGMIFLALEKRNTNILQLLLDAGASVTQVNQGGINPLQKAMQDRNEAAFKTLLPFYKLGALNNQLLQTAIEQSSTTMTQALVERGLDFKKELPNGLLPVQFAIQKGAPFIVQYLIEKGVDINSLDRQGNSLLMLAIKSRKENISIYLINQYADINSVNNTGENALQLAIGNRSHSIAKKLLNSGADAEKLRSTLHLQSDQYRTAAMLALSDYAISSNQINLLEEVLKIDKDAGFYQLPNDVTIIETAASSNALDMFMLLAKSAPKVETPAKGLSALHLAAKYHHVSLLEPLARLIDVNVKDDDRNTPLHQAISVNDPEAIQKLMQLGANPKIKNERGWNAKKLAKKIGHKHLKKYL